MSSRLTLLALATLTASLALVATTQLHPTHHIARRPTIDKELFGHHITTAPPLPQAAVWHVVCPPHGDGWGPFTNPDHCRHRLEFMMRTCNNPIRNGQPNPDFAPIAHNCRETYNGTHCQCVFRLVTASQLGS